MNKFKGSILVVTYEFLNYLTVNSRVLMQLTVLVVENGIIIKTLDN